jgi:hypothetical protein
MAERTSLRYRRLFEVRLLHHYWLDDGATTFESIDDQLRSQRLLRYDTRQFLIIAPNAPTRALLGGLGGVWRTTGLGFVVALPHDAVVAVDSRFEFFLTGAAGDLATYTAMTLRPRPVVELVDPSGRAIRYKDRTPVLSNLTGAVRMWGADKHLFLSSEYPSGAGEGVEELVASGSQLRPLTSDQPGAAFQQLGALAQLPVYLHQGDAPVIVAPPGVVGAPERGVELTAGAPDDVLAVIRLSPRRADDDDFSFIDANGLARAVFPVFEVHLKNRSTIWRYRKKSDGSVVSTEAQPRPLTYFGTAGTQRKPSTDGITVELDPNSPERVAQLVSEIFV